MGCTRFVEPAPGAVLTGLVRRILDGCETRSYAAASDLEDPA
jgi:hypothetical protein